MAYAPFRSRADRGRPHGDGRARARHKGLPQRLRGGERSQPRCRRRRVHGARRPVGVRQDDGVAHGRGPRGDHAKARSAIGERVVNDLSPRERDIAMVFQNYALYPHMTVAENIGFALRAAQACQRPRCNAKVEEAAQILGLTEHLRRKPGTALRRSAPARRDGPGDRPRAGRLPDGRAALEPRREAARADARRDLPHPAPARRRDDLRHPRPDRGDDDGRPGGRAACRRAAAVRRAAGPLRPPREPVRRRLHRLARDEPLSRHGRFGHRQSARG